MTTNIDRPQPSERQIQVSFLKWWALACKSFKVDERLLFHIPNGGTRNIIEAVNLKAIGTRRGVPDLFLAVPRWHSHGLFIEMKAAKGRLSTDQKEFMAMLAAAGYTVTLAASFDEAKTAVENYLRQ